MVELSVHDNGPGVTPEQRELLQERWKRGVANPSLADGHGLGWSIISAYAVHLGATLNMAMVFRNSCTSPGACCISSVAYRSGRSLVHGTSSATVAISRWEGEVTGETLRVNLARPDERKH
mgnify:CR=1 FL=1